MISEHDYARQIETFRQTIDDLKIINELLENKIESIAHHIEVSFDSNGNLEGGS